MSIEMTVARHAGAVVAALGFCLIAAAPALADGGGGGGGSDKTTTTCPPGEVYDSRSNGCVKQRSEVLPDKALTDYAYALAKEERYAEALDVLNLLHDKNTPEALNYRGYATRKLGRVDEGIAYYKKSVALDPRYTKVREYLGEAYVIKGDITDAEAQLRVIKTICGTGCEEYTHLAMAITNRSPNW